MYEKIVVATDGSRGARMALEKGFRFSRLLSLSPVVVTVMDLVGPFGEFLDPNTVEQVADDRIRKRYDEIQDASQKILAGASRLASRHSVKAESLLLRGVPLDQLVHFARQYDLLFVGAHGTTEKKSFGTGNLTEKLVRHMPCDVAVVRNKELSKKMLLALDGSPHDELTIKKGLWLARHLHATVTAVHVVTPGEVLKMKFEKSLIVERAAEHGDRMGVVVSPVVLKGLPSSRLIALSREYDLIVMGTLGITSLHDYLVGGTAELVVRFAKSSVLVIRSKEFVG